MHNVSDGIMQYVCFSLLCVNALVLRVRRQ